MKNQVILNLRNENELEFYIEMFRRKFPKERVIIYQIDGKYRVTVYKPAQFSSILQYYACKYGKEIINYRKIYMPFQESENAYYISPSLEDFSI